MFVNPNPFYLVPPQHAINAVNKNIDNDLCMDILHLCADGTKDYDKLNNALSKSVKPDGDISYREKTNANIISALDVPKDNISPLKKLKTILQVICENSRDDIPQKAIKAMNKIKFCKDLLKDEEYMQLMVGKSAGKDEGIQDEYDIAMIAPKNIAEILRFSKVFDDCLGSHSKSVKVQANIEGDEVRSRPMKSLTELTSVSPTDLAFPGLRKLDIVDESFSVHERIDYLDKQQLLYVLEDCSGSMEERDKAKAAGLMYHLLQQVLKENAIVYHRFFDDKPHKLYQYDKTNIDGAFGKYCKRTYNCGGTNFTAALQEAVKDINEWKTTHKYDTPPEICLLTDGQDDICMKVEDFDDIIVNIIYTNNNCKDEDNEQLIKKLKGKCIEI